MDYFNNEPFMDQLDPDKQIEKKSTVNTVLVVLLIASLCSTVFIYSEMVRYKKELAYYKGLGQQDDGSAGSLG